jgi:hypothetical protein
VRADLLGNFPVGLIVRKGHPLLGGECPGQTFPVLLSSRTGGALLDELRDLTSSTPHVIEDFETLTALTSHSDAIWCRATIRMRVARQSR